MTRERHARLTELFGEAIELDEAGRGALIARVRGEDPALASELAELLVADGIATSAMATGGLAPTTGELARLAPTVDALGRGAGGRAPAGGRPGDAASEPTLPQALDVSGDDPTEMDGGSSRREAGWPRIAGYRILGVLGEGGMGTVYAGEQEAPRRRVAIKVLRSTSRAQLARFAAEAEIMARLDHVGIAKIFEAGEADGHPFFVMEHVDGETLDVHAKGRPLEERLRLFAAICDAVHHAHVKGVFHRDLKPSNVMVRGDGRVAVLDFGIARVAGAEGSSGGDTRAGELIGTPVYMSPEQARLRPDEVDARSDVYTLGVILYELASGRLPYDVRRKGLPDVARAICEDPPQPLSRHDRALRGDLEAICDRALAKEPERRYGSAAALADDVRRHLEGAPVSARVPGTLEQLRRFARRRPGTAAAIGGGTVVLGIFAGVVTSLWLDARAAREAAEQERARVVTAHAVLEERTNQLVLSQARAALATDPTAAVELLRTITPRGVHPAEPREIAEEAFGRGVASEVRRGHDDEVRWVEGAPGGYVTGGYDGRALRWTYGAEAPRELMRLGRRIHAVRPSPDGRWLAIGADGGLARIVDDAGAVVAEPGPLAGDVERLAWSPDGVRLAVSDDRGRVIAWSRDGGPVRLGDAGSKIESLAWSSDGSAIAVGSEGGMVWRWEVATGAAASAAAGAKVLAVWAGPGEVAAAGVEGRVVRWRVSGGALMRIDEVASGIACKTAGFAGDGASAVLGGVDGRVARVVVGGGSRGEPRREIEPLPAHARQIRAVAISGDGRRIATSSDDGIVRVSDIASGRRLVLRGHAQRVRQLAFAAGGAELLSGDSEGAVRRWELDRVPPTVLELSGEVARVASSADGRALVTGDGEGELRRWDLATGGSVRIGAQARLTALATGARIAVSGSGDGELAWWGAGAEPGPGPRHAVPGRITALAMSRDERWVAAATSAGPIALHGGDGAPIATLPGHAGGTEAVVFSPDGSLLVSGGQDRVLRVWRTAAPSAAPLELGPIDDDTRHLLFARAGAVLVAAGDDGKVRAWTVAGGAIDRASMRVLAEHRGAVIALAGDGGDRVVSVGRDRGRSAIDLGRGVVRAVAAGATGRAADDAGGPPRAAPLPLPGARDLWIAADGKTIVIRDAAWRDHDAPRHHPRPGNPP